MVIFRLVAWPNFGQWHGSVFTVIIKYAITVARYGNTVIVRKWSSRVEGIYTRGLSNGELKRHQVVNYLAITIGNLNWLVDGFRSVCCILECSIYWHNVDLSIFSNSISMKMFITLDTRWHMCQSRILNTCRKENGVIWWFTTEESILWIQVRARIMINNGRLSLGIICQWGKVTILTRWTWRLCSMTRIGSISEIIC